MLQENTRSEAPPHPLPGKALRVCHLGKYYPPAPGGIESHVQTLARAQAAAGANVRVICVDHTDGVQPPQGTRLGTLNAWCEPDGAVRVTRTARRMSFNRLDICPDLPEVLRSLEKEPADVLHLHTPNPTMLLALAMVRPNIPLVITHHSDIIRQRILKLALRPFERFVYRRAARVQTTSSVYREGSSFLSRYDGRIEVLPLGVDLTPYHEPSHGALERAQQFRDHHGSPLWLAVGRLVYYKAMHVALEALTHVPGKLLIIGTGPLEEELKALARKLGVCKRVCWRGYVDADELIASYRAATALWFPSNARSEAFGLVQVEAMASGCPVINTGIAGSGVPWVSQHEESGLTVPVNDARALGAAAKRLLDEPKLHNRLSWGAYQRAAREFDQSTMAQRSLAIYGRAIRGEPVAAADEPEAMPVSPQRSRVLHAPGSGRGRRDPIDDAGIAVARELSDNNADVPVRELRGAGYPDASVTSLFRESLRRD